MLANSLISQPLEPCSHRRVAMASASRSGLKFLDDFDDFPNHSGRDGVCIPVGTETSLRYHGRRALFYVAMASASRSGLKRLYEAMSEHSAIVAMASASRSGLKPYCSQAHPLAG